MTHYIKLDRKYCQSVLCGDKKAEIRYNDRLYQRGDIIRFVPTKDGTEISSADLMTCERDIRKSVYRITFVATADCLAPNRVVLSIEAVEE